MCVSKLIGETAVEAAAKSSSGRISIRSDSDGCVGSGGCVGSEWLFGA